MDTGRLPEHSAPTQVEIEFTNLCNARCVACPRGNMPLGGFISEETVAAICELYKDYKHPVDGLPVRVIIAGGGEPTLHRSADHLARIIRSYGFHVTLITNASRFDRIDPEKLIENVDQVLVSFWGIEPEEYSRSMKLDYWVSLKNVDILRELCQRKRVGLAIQWLDQIHIHSTPEEIVAFWKKRGIDDLRCGGVVWNRGGTD